MTIPVSPVPGVADEIRGRLGTTIYARNTFGPYAYQYVPRVDPDTTAQRYIRGAFRTAAMGWPYTSEANRQEWYAYAAALDRASPVAQRRRPTGFNRYMAVATLRESVGTFPPHHAPTIFTLGLLHAPRYEQLLFFLVTIYFDPADRWLYQNNGRVWIYQSLPQPSTVNHHTDPFKWIGGRVGSPSSPPNPLTLRLNFFPYTGHRRIFFRARAIEEDNRLSPATISYVDYT